MSQDDNTLLILGALLFGGLAIAATRRDDYTGTETPFKGYVPAGEIPDSYKPIALNEYTIPDSVHYRSADFPLVPGDLGDLVLVAQTALNWRGYPDQPEDGFFGPELATVLGSIGRTEISESYFRDLLLNFPPLTNSAHAYGPAPAALAGSNIGRLQPFRRVRVYDQPGKTNLGFTRGQSGVYVIFENRRRVYVGMSQTDLYKTITRHFQAWDDPRQYRVTYRDQIEANDYHVAVIFATPKQAEALEKALVLKYNPRDNEVKYEAYQLDLYDEQQLSKMEATPEEEPPEDYSDIPF